MTPPRLPLAAQPGSRLVDRVARLAAYLRRFVLCDVTLEGVGVVGRVCHRVEDTHGAMAWQFSEARNLAQRVPA